MKKCSKIPHRFKLFGKTSNKCLFNISLQRIGFNKLFRMISLAMSPTSRLDPLFVKDWWKTTPRKAIRNFNKNTRERDNSSLIPQPWRSKDQTSFTEQIHSNRMLSNRRLISSCRLEIRRSQREWILRISWRVWVLGRMNWKKSNEK